MVSFVKRIKPDIVVFVDNCYGEFVEKSEPCHVGADLIAGSLIKNPGGGIVKTGGYIVGKEKWVEACSYRMTSPASASGRKPLQFARDVSRLFPGAPCRRTGP